MKKIKNIYCILACLLFFGTPIFSQSSRPIVSSISAKTNDTNSAIIVTWKLPSNAIFANDDTFLIYRQTTDFSRSSNLSNAQLIATVNMKTTRIEDSVPDLNNYWYAVVVKKNDGTLFDILVPSVNTTVLSCKLKAPAPAPIQTTQSKKITISKPEATTDMRETPLPCLHILPLLSKNEAGNVSDEALEVSKKIKTQSTSIPEPEPYFFQNEQNGEQLTGNDYSLFYIIDSYFSEKDWSSAETQLIKFLKVARPDAVAARANFYLGESYFFQKDFRNAIDCFLLSEELYKPISRKWLERALNNYNIDLN